MKITQEIIFEANDRLRWDGIWKKDMLRLYQQDESVLIFLKRCIKLIPNSTLIICSWTIAEYLFKDNVVNFFDDNFNGLKRDLNAEEDKLIIAGYVGNLDNVPILGSIYASSENYAIITSAKSPKEINYNGSNCALIYFNDI